LENFAHNGRHRRRRQRLAQGLHIVDTQILDKVHKLHGVHEPVSVAIVICHHLAHSRRVRVHTEHFESAVQLTRAQLAVAIYVALAQDGARIARDISGRIPRQCRRPLPRGLLLNLPQVGDERVELGKVHLAVAIAVICGNQLPRCTAVCVDTQRRKRALQLLGVELACPVIVEAPEHLAHVVRHAFFGRQPAQVRHERGKL